MKETKTEASHIEKTLGFDVTIEHAPMRKIRGEWVLDLNRWVLKHLVLVELMDGRVALNGAHVRFMRNFLGMTQAALGERLHVSHAAISQWESSQQEVSPITDANAMRLRLVCLLNLVPESFHFITMALEQRAFDGLITGALLEREAVASEMKLELSVEVLSWVVEPTRGSSRHVPVVSLAGAEARAFAPSAGGG